MMCNSGWKQVGQMLRQRGQGQITRTRLDSPGQVQRARTLRLQATGPGHTTNSSKPGRRMSGQLGRNGRNHGQRKKLAKKGQKSLSVLVPSILETKDMIRKVTTYEARVPPCVQVNESGLGCVTSPRAISLFLEQTHTGRVTGYRASWGGVGSDMRGEEEEEDEEDERGGGED